MIDFQTVLYLYFLLIAILIYLYIHTVEHRILITGVVSILSSSTLVIGLINYINNEKIKQDTDNKMIQNNYVEYFDKIDGYYISNPKELQSLFYEFYGYNNFPEKYDSNDKINNKNNNDNDNNKNIDNTINNITSIEYITIIKIIQYIEIIFIMNNNIFEDLNFRNRIINYTRSQKFKNVLAYNKNSFTYNFIKKLLDLQLIYVKDIEVENISIPKIN